MKTIEQAAQECEINIRNLIGYSYIPFIGRTQKLIAAAMREVCKPLQHQLRERTQWQCACGGTDCAGAIENERLRAALDVAEGALNDILSMNWVLTVDEAMRGGNTPACAAEAMHTMAGQALARIAEARK